METKTSKYILVLLLVSLMGCSSPSTPQMKLYSSSYESFSICIPSNYSLYGTLPDFIAFTSDEQYGGAYIKEYPLLSKSDFKKHIREELTEIPRKFKPYLVFENDTICCYKCNIGSLTVPITTRMYYLKKDIGNHTYFVYINGIYLNDKTIEKIYDSVEQK